MNLCNAWPPTRNAPSEFDYFHCIELGAVGLSFPAGFARDHTIHTHVHSDLCKLCGYLLPQKVVDRLIAGTVFYRLFENGFNIG